MIDRVLDIATDWRIRLFVSMASYGHSLQGIERCVSHVSQICLLFRARDVWVHNPALRLSCLHYGTQLAKCLLMVSLIARRWCDQCNISPSTTIICGQDGS